MSVILMNVMNPCKYNSMIYLSNNASNEVQFLQWLHMSVIASQTTYTSAFFNSSLMPTTTKTTEISGILSLCEVDSLTKRQYCGKGFNVIVWMLISGVSHVYDIVVGIGSFQWPMTPKTDSLRPIQNGRYLPDDVFQMHCLERKC